MKTTEQALASATSPVQSAPTPLPGISLRQARQIGRVGTAITRYGLVLLLLGIGAFKFTNAEAQAIQPLVSNSPLMFWLYSLLDVRGVSALIGVTEIGMAVLIALRPWSPRLSALGSLGGSLMFFTTLTFLVSTPGMWTVVEGFVVPTDGGFLLKDIVLLGGSLWTAAEALQASPRRSILD